MAKTYGRHLGTRLINWWFRTLTKLGLGARYRQILTVPGRKTGRPHSTPVDVIEVGGDRWLVAGYGPANWVLNTRAHGEITLSRGGHSETYKVEEVGAEDAIPVLRKYIAEIRVTRPYFDATPNSSEEAVAAELSRHAVFRLIPSTPNRHENR
jgi:deazaflavin-dependent oxidoreductase (nitroreductase family)